MRGLVEAAVLGTIVNFPWEMAHSLLYREVPGYTWQQHIVCCGLASLVDGIGIAMIFGLGAAVFREPQWTQARTPARLGFTAILGLVGALVVESVALDSGWWGYGPAMPRLPGTDIGVTPLVQFIVLPVAVLFWAMPRRWEWRRRRIENSGR